MNKIDFLSELNTRVETRWKDILEGEFFTYAMKNQIHTNLYASFMSELYHYTRHNSINQAVAAYNTASEDGGLLKFVYKHALEELGHENMVISDLRRVGIAAEGVKQSSPLAPTSALTAFIYHTSIKQGAKARLGYSFWAENCYGYIDPLLNKIKKDLGVTDRDMSFFVAHSSIDEKHAEEVEEAIERFVKTPEEMQAVIEVADTTLYLTGKLLDESLKRYLAGWTPKLLTDINEAA